MDLSYKVIKTIVKKKIGSEANSGFDFTMEQKELLRKKMGYRPNGGFEFRKE